MACRTWLERPGGYNYQAVDLALLIPSNYSDSQIDMVYFKPLLLARMAGQLMRFRRKRFRAKYGSAGPGIARPRIRGVQVSTILRAIWRWSTSGSGVNSRKRHEIRTSDDRSATCGVALPSLPR